MGAKKGEKQVRPNKEENTKRSKELFLMVLKKTMGVIAPASSKAGVSRRTVYKWMENDPEFAQEVKDIKEESIDFAESKLLENISDKREASIFFYLKTQGKHRGYIERQENINVEKDEFEDLTDDQLKEKIKREQGVK